MPQPVTSHCNLNQSDSCVHCSSTAGRLVGPREGLLHLPVLRKHLNFLSTFTLERQLAHKVVFVLLDLQNYSLTQRLFSLIKFLFKFCRELFGVLTK